MLGESIGELPCEPDAAVVPVGKLEPQSSSSSWDTQSTSSTTCSLAPSESNSSESDDVLDEGMEYVLGGLGLDDDRGPGAQLGGCLGLPRRKSADDIRQVYARALGIHKRESTVGAKVPSSRPGSCLPRNYRVVHEKLKPCPAPSSARHRPDAPPGGWLRMFTGAHAHAQAPPTPPRKEQQRQTTGGGGGVRFRDTVDVVHIPSHTQYSHRVRREYWTDASEYREMTFRNMVEFHAEGQDWQSCLEEDAMYFDPTTGRYIHPAIVELRDELCSSSSDDDESDADDGYRYRPLHTHRRQMG